MKSYKLWIAIIGFFAILWFFAPDSSMEPESAEFGSVTVVQPESPHQKHPLRIHRDAKGRIIEHVPRDAKEAMDILIATESIRIPTDSRIRFVHERAKMREQQKLYPAQFQKDQLKISTPKGTLPLWVGLANTGRLRAEGLMHHRAFPAGFHAIFFQFPSTDIRDMWMKNTYLPLDIVFIDETGHVVHIHENATPLSTDTISSRYPCKAVLEIPAGSTKQWNISLGSLVLHSFFATSR